jgi:hypothetical protein
LRRIDDEHVQIAFNETTTIVDLDELIEIFATTSGKSTPSTNYVDDSFYDDR